MPDNMKVEDRDFSEPMDPRELLEELILAIISDPSEMHVTEIEERDNPNVKILQVQVGASDRGKVIGKNGVIAGNLRSLFGLIGQRTNTRIEVRIDGGPDHKPRPRNTNQGHFSQNPGHGHNQNFVPEGYMVVPVPQPYYNNNSNNRFNNNNRRFRNNGG